ncbi:MAG: F0F1 ATP synthase subunit delta [Actinobacteria bacterium]|nr:F0F1 ATP synthase subunit delta [Actinomycetota bacterium]
MPLDAFTIIAQIFNFVVLMLLLRRFLYGPIVRTMDARETHITMELDEAERKECEARHEAAELKREREELEDQRGEFLTQAQMDADQKRNELVKEARDEVEARKAAWQEAIAREKESFLDNLRQRAGEQVYIITRRVLSDLANVDLEQFIIDSFLKRLRSMEDEGLDRVAAQMSELRRLEADEAEKSALPKPEAAITTAFDIDEDARRRIEQAVHERLGPNVQVRFEVTPKLICGIELKTRGYKAAWSLQDYLETLDESLSRAFTGREPEAMEAGL